MSEEIVREYFVGEFRGSFPDVPIADGVDIEAIRQRDPDPMFVTLPVAEIGAVSNNGLLYDEALVDSIAEQINRNRPGGIFGHLKEEERSTSFPLPAGLWVGALKVGQTLWAKSYISPGAARDYVGNLKAVGAQLATSIYGRGKSEKVREGVRRLLSLKLESLDFAPPGRAALGLGAVPYVTAEMSPAMAADEMDLEQEPIMADKAQVIAELTVADIPAPLREAIVAEASKQDQTQQTIAELTSTVTAKDAVIAELTSAVEEMRRERVTTAIEAAVAELTDWQVADEDGKAKLAKLRGLLRGQIATRLGDQQTVERVAEIAGAAWEDIKPIAEMVRDALAGPAAVVNGRVHATGIKPVEDTPENRQRAMSHMGIQI
jgi:hypothetical protein